MIALPHKLQLQVAYWRQRLTGPLIVLAYLLTIPAANWSITHLGQCHADGPCTIPVGFGLAAPSGVLWIGLAFILRDMAQRQAGRRPVIIAVLAGAALSAVFSPALALASGAAFLLSETADMLVYTPLERRRWLAAVVLSNTVGLLVDSVLFLLLAFGSLDFLAGQVVGKAWITLLFIPVGWYISRRHAGKPVAA